MNFNERLRERMEDFNRKMKEDPNYIIKHLTDKDGTVRVYFDPETYIDLYREGHDCTGSTESLEPSDIIQRVPAERIKSITHGGVIVEVKGE